tara:strand:- start:163 stop:531 length:369 start_codon:yes stop_codon:yes gene_type:complete
MNYKKDIFEKRLNDFLGSDPLNKDMDDDELHCEVFNSQDFISDRNQAIEFLGNKTFDILDFVRTYEIDNFGELNTDISNPIRLLNMYAYIIGKEIVEDYFEKRNRHLKIEKLGDYISAIQGI